MHAVSLRIVMTRETPTKKVAGDKSIKNLLFMQKKKRNIILTGVYAYE